MAPLITNDESEIVVRGIKTGDLRGLLKRGGDRHAVGRHDLPGRRSAGAHSASCAAIVIGIFLIAMNSPASERRPDLGSATGNTPYDRFFGPLRRVMGLGQNHPTLDEASELVHEGRGFRYSHNEPFVPQMPAVTRRLHAGDCKDKSLWLASVMDDASLRFVIGKYTRGARKSHAWLLWKDQGRWFILDATMKSSAVELADTSENDWVPLYSYSAHGKYRHSGARTLAGRELPRPIGGFRIEPQLAGSGKGRGNLDFSTSPRARRQP